MPRRRPSPTSSSGSSSRGSRSCCSRRCRPRCSRSWRTSRARASDDDFRERAAQARRSSSSAIGVLGVIAAGTARPDGRRDPLRRQVQPRQHVDLALLAAGSGLFILALTLAQALIALHRPREGADRVGHRTRCLRRSHRASRTRTCSTGWRSAFIAGAAAAALAMGVFVVIRLRTGIPEGGLALARGADRARTARDLTPSPLL